MNLFVIITLRFFALNLMDSVSEMDYYLLTGRARVATKFGPAPVSKAIVIEVPVKD